MSVKTPHPLTSFSTHHLLPLAQLSPFLDFVETKQFTPILHTPPPTNPSLWYKFLPLMILLKQNNLPPFCTPHHPFPLVQLSPFDDFAETINLHSAHPSSHRPLPLKQLSPFDAFVETKQFTPILHTLERP